MENSDMTPEEVKKAYEEGNFMEIFKELTKKLRAQADYVAELEEAELEQVGSEAAELDPNTPKGMVAQELDVAGNYLSKVSWRLDELYSLIPDTPKWKTLKYGLGEIIDTIDEIESEKFEELLKDFPEDTEGEWDLD